MEYMLCKQDSVVAKAKHDSCPAIKFIRNFIYLVTVCGYTFFRYVGISFYQYQMEHREVKTDVTHLYFKS